MGIVDQRLEGDADSVVFDEGAIEERDGSGVGAEGEEQGRAVGTS